MKLTKGELKDIVKECLIEIFSESFNLMEAKSPGKVPNRQLNERKVSAPKQRPVPIANVPRTGDPILDSIIADTARTTLPAMLEAEGRRNSPTNPGLTERLVAEAEPEALFGEEAASKWAALAFNDFSGKS